MTRWSLIQTGLTVASLMAAVIAANSCADAKAAVVVAEADLDTQRALVNGTVAMLAKTRYDKDSIRYLREAAQELNAKLLAAVRLHVPARDTVVVHDTVVTELLADSTRQATFRDSTFAGVITGIMTAPPCCAPLGIRYDVSRPAFDPAVAFLRVGNRVAVVVDWRGETVRILSPYSAIPAAEKRVRSYVLAVTDPFLTWTVEGGVTARAFWGLSAVARGTWRLEYGEPARLEAGFKKEF